MGTASGSPTDIYAGVDRVEDRGTFADIGRPQRGLRRAAGCPATGAAAYVPVVTSAYGAHGRPQLRVRLLGGLEVDGLDPRASAAEKARALWRHGILAAAPPCIDAAVVAMDVEGHGRDAVLSVLMEDVTEFLVPEADATVPPDQRRGFIEHLAALSAAFWG